MSDLIERQVVFDLCDMRDRYEIPYEYDEDGKHIKGYDEGRIINVTKLKMLPPVKQESSGDLISRQASISKIKELFSLGDCYCDEYSIVGTLNGMSSAKQEPKEGHWISYYCAVTNERWYACSHCRSEVKSKTDYCPSCGYKMESEGI